MHSRTIAHRTPPRTALDDEGLAGVATPGKSYAEKLRDREYSQRFTEWVASLPPAKRRKLKTAKANRPLLDDAPADDAGFDGGDVADWSIASHTPDIAGLVDTMADQLMEQFDLDDDQAPKVAAWMGRVIEAESERRQASTLQRVIAFLMRGGNVKLRVYGLAFACDLGALNGLPTQAYAARLLGLSRSAMSICTNEWSDLLGLPRTKHMKSQAARERFSADKLADHWRHRKSASAPALVCNPA